MAQAGAAGNSAGGPGGVVPGTVLYLFGMHPPADVQAKGDGALKQEEAVMLLETGGVEAAAFGMGEALAHPIQHRPC
jgi:hypothetical protein